MQEVLVARDLARSFGQVRAVDGVSLTVHAGEIVGLLGPNGAGKTTTLRMLAGILTPDAGDVRIRGVDVHAEPLAAKRRLGFLSGDTHLYQRLTPVEVLVDELEMASFKDRPCSTLSSGQKQRANIARAFLHEPDLLILDEPTNALDVVSGQFVAAAIRRKRGEGRAVLFSTHIMSEAEYLCDRIALMHAGRLVDEGSLSDLLVRSQQANLTDAFLHHVGPPSPQSGYGEAGP
jgi:sodium transport system ATP-binding protein